MSYNKHIELTIPTSVLDSLFSYPETPSFSAPSVEILFNLEVVWQLSEVDTGTHFSTVKMVTSLCSDYLDVTSAVSSSLSFLLIIDANPDFGSDEQLYAVCFSGTLLDMSHLSCFSHAFATT